MIFFKIFFLLLKFLIEENLYLPNYLPAHLKYTDITSCLLIASNQFIDAYTTLGYFESINYHSIEIVKLKSKYKNNREILLISNESIFDKFYYEPITLIF